MKIMYECDPGGWISAGASSGTLVQLLVSQTLGRPDDAVMVTLLVRSSSLASSILQLTPISYY